MRRGKRPAAICARRGASRCFRMSGCRRAWAAAYRPSIRPPDTPNAGLSTTSGRPPFCGRASSLTDHPACPTLRIETCARSGGTRNAGPRGQNRSRKNKHPSSGRRFRAQIRLIKLRACNRRPPDNLDIRWLFLLEVYPSGHTEYRHGLPRWVHHVAGPRGPLAHTPLDNKFVKSAAIHSVYSCAPLPCIPNPTGAARAPLGRSNGVRALRWWRPPTRPMPQGTLRQPGQSWEQRSRQGVPEKLPGKPDTTPESRRTHPTPLRNLPGNDFRNTLSGSRSRNLARIP